MSTAAVRQGMPLTGREAEVLALAAEGLSNVDIGARLWISVETVRNHLRSGYAKLGANNRANAVYLALKAGAIR